jgi:hypothetical protein
MAKCSATARLFIQILRARSSPCSQSGKLASSPLRCSAPLPQPQVRLLLARFATVHLIWLLKAGKLIFSLAGPKDDVAKIRPYTEGVMGRKVIEMGEDGKPLARPLAVQLMNQPQLETQV